MIRVTICGTMGTGGVFFRYILYHKMGAYRPSTMSVAGGSVYRRWIGLGIADSSGFCQNIVAVQRRCKSELNNMDVSTASVGIISIADILRLNKNAFAAESHLFWSRNPILWVLPVSMNVGPGRRHNTSSSFFE